MPWAKILGVLGQVGSGLFSAAVGALTLIGNMLDFGFRTAMQYHQESIAFARSVGMSLKESISYTDTLSQRAIDLGKKYGIAADAVNKLEQSLDAATNRQLRLSNAQAERMVRINKLVGEQVSTKFTEEMMLGMGAQINTMQGAVSKAYADATKHGLNATKMAEKVAQHLSMANRFAFRNGVDGLTKMVMQAEKLGVNLQSVESAMNNFLELDKAIETSAQLQMLGGSAAAMFGNPLTAAYEANYDPEAFQDRLINSLGSYATFDQKKGMSVIGSMNMDFIRSISKALGISADEAAKMAKKQAEVRYKETNFSSQLRGFSSEERDYILNRSQIEGNRLKIGGQDISELRRSGELAKMMELSKMSTEEIEMKQALELTSINEKLKGIWTSIGGHLSKVFNKFMPLIAKWVDQLGQKVLDNMPRITKAMDELLNNILTEKNLERVKAVIQTFIDNASKGIESILKGANTIVGWLQNIEKWTKLAYYALLAWGGFKLGSSMFKAMRGGAVPASAAGGATAASATAAGATAASGSGGGSPSSGGGTGGALASGKHGGATITAGTENGRAYEQFNKDGQSYRRYSDGTYEQLKGKRGNKSWKPVSPSKVSQIEGIYQERVAANPTPRTTRGATSAAETAAREGGATSAAQNAAKIGRLANGARTAGAFAKGAWPVATIVGAIEGGASLWDYFSTLDELLASPKYSRDEKKQLIQAARKNRNNQVGSAAGGIIGSIGGAAGAGFIMGSVFPGLGNLAGAVVGTVLGLAGGAMGYLAGKWGGEKVADALLDPSKVSDEELDALLNDYYKSQGLPDATGFEEGGIVGGNAYSGDRNWIRANSREMMLPLEDQYTLLNYIKSTLPEVTRVMSKPVVGERPEYIYRPTGYESYNVNGNTITVKDFNINLSGTLKLDGGGNNYKNIDINALLNDYHFINALKDKIKMAINNDMNNGRFMNDLATMRGQISSTSIIGK